MDLVYTHRGEELTHKYLSMTNSSSDSIVADEELNASESSRIMLNCTIPLSEIVTNFFDELKSRSSGFASFE